VPSASITTKSGFDLNDAIRVKFSEDVVGVNSTNLTMAAGGGNVVATSAQQINGTTWDVRPNGRWVAGEQYSIALGTGIKSVSGNMPAAANPGQVRSTTTVDSASGAVSKRKGDRAWKTTRASGAIGKSYVMTKPKKKTKNPSWVQTTVRGSAVSVYACKSPTSGKAKLLVDGKVVQTVNLYKRSTKCGKVVGAALSPGEQHTVRFQVTGTKFKKSKGRAVRFDAFKVS
jgi:hypothetical protein